MLSRFTRQVAHALLTRPPLTQGSKPPLVRSTWMCYARRQRSSWARIKLSNILYINYLSAANILHSSFLLLFYFVSGLFLRNFRDLYFVQFYLTLYMSRCLIFNVHFSPALADSFVSISHFFSFVNTFFLSFLRFFVWLPNPPLFFGECVYIITFFAFVKHFFEKILRF